MSDIIAAKIKIKDDCRSVETTEALFNVVRNGCNQRIAIKIFPSWTDDFEFAIDELEPDEMLLIFCDSYNRELASPLIGADRDYEVKKYSPIPLIQRLTNLQILFESILKQENILKLEVLLTSGDLKFNKEVLLVAIQDFATFLEPQIEYARFPSFHYQFCWVKET